MKIEDSNIVYTGGLSAFTYTYSIPTDSVTFFQDNKLIATGILSDTTINGTQLTETNIDTELDKVFKTASGGGVSDAYTKAETDAKFLPFAGGTMTGEIIFNGVPSGNSAVNVGGANISNIGTIVGKNINNEQVLIEFNHQGKLQVNTQNTSTWTGSDTIIEGVAIPTSDNHAANKKYIDNIVGNINTILDVINGEII
ncbi:hypothetical protein [Dysgonomonas sp. 520]|uniref:hypothetical protein n=1 Tax=Dysgonomonas sp. 520 TaxID=2302931 RepID=UPI0013D37A39|nr:hypothetical protein [Dysgonomonas sp. 520]